MCDQPCTPTPSKGSSVLHRAKLARFLAAVLSPPTPVLRQRLSDSTVHDELRESATQLGIDPALVDAVFKALCSVDEMEEAYHCLIGHAVRSECPPYELEYRDSEVFQQSQTLADIVGYYRAFGFDMSTTVHERADHVAAEWEYLAILALKEWKAASQGDAECCIMAQKDFFAEHVSVWMPAFLSRIRRFDPDSFYSRVAVLAESVLRHSCDLFGVTSGPSWLELRPIVDEDTTISCGTPGAVELGPTLAAALGEGD
ncbi:MAG: molecular chaperone TorD family protein [Planctomycetota bacterium]